MAKIVVDLVTPSSLVLHKEVDEICVPGKLGEFGILPQHTPFLTVLGVGILTFVDGDQKLQFVIDGGFAEVSQDHVIVLTETCEEASKINLEEARVQLSKVEKDLTQSNPEDYEEYWNRLQKASARLAAAERADF